MYINPWAKVYTMSGLHYAVPITKEHVTTVHLYPGLCNGGNHVRMQHTYSENGDIVMVNNQSRNVWIISGKSVPPAFFLDWTLMYASIGGNIFTAVDSSLMSAKMIYGRWGDSVTVTGWRSHNSHSVVNGDGSKIYFGNGNKSGIVSVIDTAADKTTQVKFDGVYWLNTLATDGPVIYVDVDGCISTYDTRCRALDTHDIDSGLIIATRVCHSSLVIQRYVQHEGTTVIGESAVIYDLRNRAEYCLDYITPFGSAQVYI